MKHLLLICLFFQTAFAFAQSLNRPQHPTPPFPYESIDVRYDHPTDTALHFAATLTKPPGKGPFAAALLISGSGQSERDMPVNGHRMMLVIADQLTRAGIAVLRFDDRAAGKSTKGSKPIRTMTAADFNSDAQAGIDFLKTHPAIDPEKIGIIGHSAGSGNAVALASGAANKIAFIVLMAGADMKPIDIFNAQTLHIAKLKNVSAEGQNKLSEFLNSSMNILKQEAEPDLRRTQLAKLADRTLLEMTAADTAAIKEQLVQRAKDLSLNFFRESLLAQSEPMFQKITCPVLCMNGGKDVLVPGKAAAASFNKALKGHRDYQVELFPELNHMFQNTPIGFMDEGAAVEETFDAAALKLMVHWVKDHAKR
jgi:pimeloyl-ACP methyl ester carboxylesterase